MWQKGNREIATDILQMLADAQSGGKEMVVPLRQGVFIAFKSYLSLLT